MTRKTLLILTLLGLLLVGACPKPTKLIRLTVVNKSGLPIEIGMTGQIYFNEFQKNTYYLSLQKNDPRGSTVREFTVIPDKYSMQFNYIELWDPVYGKRCKAITQTVEAYHNTRIMVPDCKFKPPNKGEPSMVKVGGRRVCPKHRPVHPMRKPGC